MNRLIDKICKRYFNKTPISGFALKRIISKVRKGKSNNRCFILGNGPSLTWDDIKKIDSKHTFAFNKIYLLPGVIENKWHPKYYMVEDQLVLDQNIEEISNFASQHNEMYKFFRFFYLSPYKNISNLYEYNYCDYKDPRFSLDVASEVICGYSVVYSAIQFAVALGYKEIILLGVDFNFGNTLKLKTNKENLLISEGEINHFSETYRKPGELWNKPNLENQELYFNKAKSITIANDIKIIDCTRNGKLTVFQKATLEDIK